MSKGYEIVKKINQTIKIIQTKKNVNYLYENLQIIYEKYKSGKISRYKQQARPTVL